MYAPTFQTVWFLESIATQILVIFLIRSRGRFWTSHPHWVLVVTSLGALIGAIVLALSPLRRAFGFVALSAQLDFAVIAIVLLYLACAETAKRFAISSPSLRQQRAAASIAEE